MFKCQQCEQSGYKPNRIVVERKMVKHVGASAGPRGGVGSQIVREVVICDACAGKIVEAPIERAELVPEKKEVAPGVTFEGQAIDNELAS
jgi:hypothetical protein